MLQDIPDKLNDLDGAIIVQTFSEISSSKEANIMCYVCEISANISSDIIYLLYFTHNLPTYRNSFRFQFLPEGFVGLHITSNLLS